MKPRTIKTFIDRFHLCHDARTWLESQRSLAAAWDACERSDWMLWALGRIGYSDDSALRLFACWCVRQVWRLLTDERSRRAVEVAERFAEGQATQKELSAARDAAWAAARDAAWAAAWAAGDAAWAAARDAAGAAAWAAGDAARDAAWAARAAGDAARDAAGAAAWAAGDAARDAAWAARAAGDAAGDAARAARDAARDAAWAAARDAQADELRRRIPNPWRRKGRTAAGAM